jgi:hypothetical protein
MRRIAVAGSVAAAASLALVVGVSLQHKPEPAAEVPALTVHAPVVPSAVDEARRNAQPSAAPSGGTEPGVGPTPPAPAHKKMARSQAPKDESRAAAESKQAAPPPPPAKVEAQRAPPPPPANVEAQAAPSPPPAKVEAEAAPPPPSAPEKEDLAARDGTVRARMSEKSNALGAPQPLRAAPSAPGAVAGQMAADADSMETAAETSRRAGRYEAAAQLYRDAAAARRSSGEATRAAWNLAHAVECLAAASRLGEAARVREDLLRDFPGEDAPRRAADRALASYPQR